MVAERTAPIDRNWVVAIHEIDRHRPIGTGVVIDDRRVLTSRHVVHGRAIGNLRVAFPWAENPLVPPAAVSDIRAADHEEADVAVIELAAALPAGVQPAPLSRPKGADLVGTGWWAYGFMDRRGNDASGEIGGDLAYGWVRIDGNSRYLVEEGFSGSGLWSAAYQAVVGILGQRHGTGDGRAFTLAMATHALPDEKLTALIDAWDLRRSGADAALSWGWELGTDPEGRRHWRPRARGVTGDSERGYRFSGRRAALMEIVDWLSTDRPESKVLVVTGSPGVGKSAVLARVVTTADEAIAAELPADDEAVRAPSGSVACAVHAKGKTALEVATEIARAASATLPRRVEDAVPAIRETLVERGGRRFNVVVDALDEAAGPAEARLIVGKLLVPLAETCSDVGAGVLVGTRRRDDDGDLTIAFGPARREIDLDLSRYFALEDLTAYALVTLQLRGAERPGNPYSNDAVATPVATRIAEIAEPNFLVAGLRARTRGLHDDVAVAVDAIGAPTVGDPVAAALRDYLAVIPSVESVTATEALTALGYAESPGLTLDLWSTAILALTGHNVSPNSLKAFARRSAANFLVETSETTASYRLFHQALSDSLTAERDIVGDQKTLTNAFLDFGRDADWTEPYLRRSLAHHAAAGGIIDAVLAEPALLLHTDLRRLIPLSRQARTARGRERARLLRRTPSAVPAKPRERLGLFSLTEAFDNLGHDFRALSAPTSFRARWARARRGAEEATLDGHATALNGVCAIRAGDRDLLASAGSDGTVRLWDPTTGDPIATLKGHTGEVYAVCAIRAGDRDLLASASADSTVRLWDPTGPTEPIATMEGHVDAVSAVCATRADNWDLLASAGIDGTVRLWDPTSPTEPIATMEGHDRAVYAVCAIRAGDRELLASASSDGTIRLWDPTTGLAKPTAATLVGHSDEVYSVCATRVGDWDLLASASADRTVRLWDPTTGDLIADLKGHTSQVHAVCAIRAGDRDLLASASADDTVRLWEPATGDPVATLAGDTNSVIALCATWTGDHELLASASGDGTIRLWDPTLGQTEPVASTLKGHTGGIYAVCSTRIGDQALLASASGDGAVRLWNPTNGDPFAITMKDQSAVLGMCATRLGDRELLACVGNERTIRLWDPTTGNLITVLDGHTSEVNAVCTARIGDRSILASAGDDRTVRLWDPSAGDLIATLRGHASKVHAVCAVQDSDRPLLASGGADGTILLWDPTTGDLIDFLDGHTGRVDALCAVQAGGREVLASAGSDRTVRLWDPSTHHPIAILNGHTGWVHAVCAIQANDRELLASASSDRTVRLWDPTTGQVEALAPVQYSALAVTNLGEGLLAVGLMDGLLVIGVSDATETETETEPAMPGSP